MKKNYSIIILCLLALCLFLPLTAQEADSTDIMVSTQLERYGISENSTLLEVSEFVNISIDSLSTQFKLNQKDRFLTRRTLKSLRLDPEEIIIFRDNSQYSLNHNYTISQVCDKFHIPPKKLLKYLHLGIQDKSNYTKTLLDLKVTPEKIVEINEQFLEEKPEFGAILTIIGMLVVFGALAITAFVISQLAYFNKKKQPTPIVQSSVQTPIGTIKTTKPENLSSAAIIAVITAIHIRKQELEEESKVLLTWKRASVSMWQASGIVQFPNAQFRQFKK